MFKFCSFFAKTALELVCGRRNKEVGKTIQLVANAKSDASELRPLVKRADDCKQILNDR